LNQINADSGIPADSMRREIALAFQNFKLNLQHLDISAAQFAEATDRDFLPTSPMPTPSIAAQ